MISIGGPKAQPGVEHRNELTKPQAARRDGPCYLLLWFEKIAPDTLKDVCLGRTAPLSDVRFWPTAVTPLVRPTTSWHQLGDPCALAR